MESLLIHLESKGGHATETSRDCSWSLRATGSWVLRVGRAWTWESVPRAKHSNSVAVSTPLVIAPQRVGEPEGPLCPLRELWSLHRGLQGLRCQM